jgi:hypothetical protein
MREIFLLQCHSPGSTSHQHRLWGLHIISVYQTGDLRLGSYCGVRLIRTRGVSR